MNCTIYVLKDPITKEIRYVGKTIDVDQRYFAHKVIDLTTQKGTWVNDLDLKGEEPIIEEIETVTIEESPARELFWIEHYEKKGCNLFNLSKPKNLNACSKSGRKPVDDKKVAICVYVQESRITKLGLENLRSKFIEMIETDYKNSEA